ncbi:free fatty acid receptor 2 [Camelus ferus]|nr:free fatty acid receptor 2 [Camelus ferus]
MWTLHGLVREHPALADLQLQLLLPSMRAEAASDFLGAGPWGTYPVSSLATASTAALQQHVAAGGRQPGALPGSGLPRAVQAVPPAPVWAHCALVNTVSLRHCSIVVSVQYLPATKRLLRLVLPVRLALCLVLFFIPMAATIFCYRRFVRIILSQPHVGTWRRWRAMGLAVMTLFNFVICFGPYNVSHVVGFFQWKNPTWRACTVLLSTPNACIDPLIFYFSSSAMRKAFDKRLQRLQSWAPHCQGTGGAELESRPQREGMGA